MEKSICLEEINERGLLKYEPVCDLSKLVCHLMKKKKLSPRDLQEIMYCGWQIHFISHGPAIFSPTQFHSI